MVCSPEVNGLEFSNQYLLRRPLLLYPGLGVGGEGPEAGLEEQGQVAQLEDDDPGQLLQVEWPQHLAVTVELLVDGVDGLEEELGQGLGFGVRDPALEDVVEEGSLVRRRMATVSAPRCRMKSGLVVEKSCCSWV